jgi:hypothetical protein
MDTNTINGTGRGRTGQLPRPGGVPAVLRELLELVGFVLGLGLAFILLYANVAILWGIADAGLDLTGARRTTVEQLVRLAAGLSLLLLPLLPIGAALGTAALASAQLSRRQRRWAAVVGIVTGVLVVVDVLALVVAGHLAHLF